MYPTLLNLDSLNEQQKAEVLRHTPLFDEAWYRSEYPEIGYHNDGNPDPAYHYANFGYKEGRLPSLLFNGIKYAQELGLGEVNPLLHYLANGGHATHGIYNDYRVNERLQEVLVKHSLGIDLTLGERTLALESVFMEKLGHQVDLTYAPLTLQEKIFALRATNSQELELVSDPLFSGKARGQHLREHFGLSEELAPVPFSIVPNAADLDYATLPQSFYVECNGASRFNFFVFNKNKFKPQTLRHELTRLQEECRAFLKIDAFAPSYQVDPYLMVYANTAPLNEAQSLSKQGQEIKQYDYELWTFNGQVKLVLVHGPHGAITLFDRDFNLLPTAISFDERGSRPIDASLTKPDFFDSLIKSAELVGKDLPCAAISCLAIGNKYTVSGVQLYPYNGIFLLTNGFSRKLSGHFQLPTAHLN